MRDSIIRVATLCGVIWFGSCTYATVKYPMPTGFETEDLFDRAIAKEDLSPKEDPKASVCSDCGKTVGHASAMCVLGCEHSLVDKNKEEKDSCKSGCITLMLLAVRGCSEICDKGGAI